MICPLFWQRGAATADEATAEANVELMAKEIEDQRDAIKRELSKLACWAARMGASGFEVRTKDNMVSHLQYPKDTLIWILNECGYSHCGWQSYEDYAAIIIKLNKPQEDKHED